MPSFLDTHKLATMVRTKRGSRGLRATASGIGEISASTLSRVENGKAPDMAEAVAYLRVSSKAQDYKS